MTGVLAGLIGSNAATAAPAAVTLDPAHLFEVSLTNGNLTASANHAGNDYKAIVRSTTSHTTGKYYMELSYDNGGNAYDSIGIMNASFNIGSDNSYATANNSCWFFPLGSIFDNGADSTKTFTGLSIGDKLCFAVDVGAKLAWIRKASGTWYGSAGGGDPAAGTSGFAYTPTGAVFISVSCYNTAVSSSSINFGATSFTYTPPSGFGNW